MCVIQSKAWAKVNLAFHVVGRRPDGYHDIETVMHRIELADLVRVERLDHDLKSESGYDIEVGVCPQTVPGGMDNIAHRAAWAFFERTGERGAVSIEIEKRIPVAAGLGGGSADAAAVLAGMNQLWGNPLSYEELSDVARSVGADVPFCLMCHGDPPQAWAAMARGIGDRLTPLPPLPGVAMVLAKPEASLSAGEIYGMWDVRMQTRGDRGSKSACRRQVSATKAQALADFMRTQGLRSEEMARAVPLIVNELEPLGAERCPDVLEVKAALLDLGAMVAIMSGSGPTVFGLFESDDSAYAAAQGLRDRAASCTGGGGLDVIITRAGPRSTP